MVSRYVRRTPSLDMFPRQAALALCALVSFLAAVPTGALYVTTLPSAADVWLDGTYIGHSPVLLDALAAGRHTVSLNRTGWMSQDVDVNVFAGKTALSSIALTRSVSRALRGSDGSFTVRGLTTRSLQLDGIAIEPDRLGTYNAASGTHELIAQTAAGKMTRTITVYPDMRTDIVLLHDEETTMHSAVVAPVADFLPARAVKVDGLRVTIRYLHQDVDATIGTPNYHINGRSVSFDAAPTLIGAALYLPLELLKQLTANGEKDK